jgi:hypothetical protein
MSDLARGQHMRIDQIIGADHPITDREYRDKCRDALDRDGVLTLQGFFTLQAINQATEEGISLFNDAYFCKSSHNIYLTPTDTDLPQDHPHNRQVISSKGLVGDDQVPDGSPLKTLYRDAAFKSFVAHVVGQDQLYPYADPLSSVNIHYAGEGQELGWHFDNSSFAITLLLDKPQAGGVFEYVRDLRNADAGDMNYDGVAAVLDGKVKPRQLQMDPGTLVLFRGRNSLHRVTPTEGKKVRLLAVLAYNSKPGIELSESARTTFYGRLN